MMTLNEAIQHCREKEDCTKCGQEHKQLRQWLEDYQSLLDSIENAPHVSKWYGGVMCAEDSGTFLVKLTYAEYEGVKKYIMASRNCYGYCGACNITDEGFDNMTDAYNCKDYIDNQYW